MNVSFNRDMMCGAVEVPAGDYVVTLDSGTHELNLVGGGKTIKVTAVKRRGACRTRYESATLIPAGGNNFSLVFMTPKLGEWVSMFESKIEGKKYV